MRHNANVKTNDMITMRRERVASLRARGLSLREIADTLSNPGNPAYMVNPATGQPFELGTIWRDVVALRKASQERAAEAITAHIGDQLLDLAEVKRAAWAGRNLPVVLRALEREAKLLGLDAPTRIDITLAGQVIQLQTLAEQAGVNLPEVFNALIAEFIGAQAGSGGAGENGPTTRDRAGSAE